MKLNFNFSPTCIGSVPHTDAKEICEKILTSFKNIPFWPQLPKRSFLENMYAQYSEGLPNIKIDEKKKSIYLDTSDNLSSKIEAVYEKYLSEDLGYFAITEAYAKGFYEFVKQVKNKKPKSLKFVKGQVTGPVSFGLAVVDEMRQPIFHNQELQEVLTKVLCMKIKWQVRKLKEICDKVIICIDEPYMVSIGSSYINIKPEEAAKRIKELVEEVHKEGAVAGIHCCGNTDWGMLLKMGIDIINLDAYDFIESISLYPEELKKFLQSGKCVAWGIVPTDAGKEDNLDVLLDKLNKGFDILSRKGIERKSFLGSSLVTPSCGCGTLSVSQTEKVFELTLKISKKLKDDYEKSA